MPDETQISVDFPLFEVPEIDTPEPQDIKYPHPSQRTSFRTPEDDRVSQAQDELGGGVADSGATELPVQKHHDEKKPLHPTGHVRDVEPGDSESDPEMHQFTRWLALAEAKAALSGVEQARAMLREARKDTK